MASITGPVLLAATGSTGNNTHTGVNVAPSTVPTTAFEFIVEVAGATPSITWKVQGTIDPVSVTDANANWVDIPYLPANTDVSAVAALTATAVGGTLIFLDTASGQRFFRRLRLVTSANTNVTYRCEATILQV